jgi:hypothetical protein
MKFEGTISIRVQYAPLPNGDTPWVIDCKLVPSSVHLPCSEKDLEKIIESSWQTDTVDNALASLPVIIRQGLNENF